MTRIMFQPINLIAKLKVQKDWNWGFDLIFEKKKRFEWRLHWEEELACKWATNLQKHVERYEKCPVSTCVRWNTGKMYHLIEIIHETIDCTYLLCENRTGFYIDVRMYIVDEFTSMSMLHHRTNSIKSYGWCIWAEHSNVHCIPSTWFCTVQ